MATSSEPYRCSAYSEDLRWRMVWQRLAMGYKYEEIGRNLGVDPSTVQRTVCLFEETGSVQKRRYPSGRVSRKVTPTVELILLTLVVERPGILLRELQAKLHQIYEIDISLATICQFLRKSGFSRQKMTIIAKQRDEDVRAQFALDVSVYTPEMFIFLDETGADRRNTIRKYGYSVRGRPARSQKLLIRGQLISALPLMSVKGLLDCKIVEGAVNGDVFYTFVQTHLIPVLQPYNGTNPQCGCVGQCVNSSC